MVALVVRAQERFLVMVAEAVGEEIVPVKHGVGALYLIYCYILKLTALQ